MDTIGVVELKNVQCKPYRKNIPIGKMLFQLKDGEGLRLPIAKKRYVRVMYPQYDITYDGDSIVVYRRKSGSEPNGINVEAGSHQL